MSRILQIVINWLNGVMRIAHENYSVDPVVFVVLIVACAPFFYYSIYRLVRCVAKRETQRIAMWSTVFLGSTALPYIYVLLFGRNIPWYIYVVIGLLLAQGVYSLVKRLRGGGKKSAGSPSTAIPPEAGPGGAGKP